MSSEWIYEENVAYIVTVGEYSDRSIEGVFLSKQDAEEYTDELLNIEYGGPAERDVNISVYPVLDDGKPKIISYYSVTVNTDLEIINKKEKQCGDLPIWENKEIPKQSFIYHNRGDRFASGNSRVSYDEAEGRAKRAMEEWLAEQSD